MFTAVVRYFHIRVSIHSSRNQLQINFPASRNCVSKYNKSSLEPMGSLFINLGSSLYTRIPTRVVNLKDLFESQSNNGQTIRGNFHQHEDLKYVLRYAVWGNQAHHLQSSKKISEEVQRSTTRSYRSLVKTFSHYTLSGSSECTLSSENITLSKSHYVVNML